MRLVLLHFDLPEGVCHVRCDLRVNISQYYTVENHGQEVVRVNDVEVSLDWVHSKGAEKLLESPHVLLHVYFF